MSAQTIPGRDRGLGVQRFTFSIVGVQKCGTSTLAELLNAHPAVCRPPRKEMGYFDDDDRDWSAPDHAGYAVWRRHRAHRAMGDATPRYLLWPGALERMHDYDPAMRLLAILRDPIDRLVSHWTMVRERQGERAPDWPEWIAYRPDDVPRAVPEHFGGRSAYLRASGVVRGYYGSQLRHGFAVFPAEQWLVLDFHRFLADHERQLDAVTAHLGLAPFGAPPALKHLMAAGEGAAPAPAATAPTGADLKLLARTFEPQLAELHALTGLDVAQWTTSRLLAGDLDADDRARAYAAKAGL